VLASEFCSLNVLVRINPFADIGKIFPFLYLEQYSTKAKIDKNKIPDNLQIYPTKVWYLPTERGYKTLGEKHLFSVEKQIGDHKIAFDLIHAHFTWSSGYVGARLKERYGVPFVVTAHGYDIYSLPFKDVFWRKNIEYVLNTADRIITVSQSNFDCIRKLDVNTPVHVIPNGFRRDLFKPREMSECRRVLCLPLDKKILLTVGNLVPVKGQKYLVEAFKEIVGQRKDILCVIVGIGTEKDALMRQIRSLGLKDYISLAGRRPHYEIPLWMNASDIFVLPSMRESFGVVQIEAMACGKPVVATRNGGSEEIITSDEYGLLVEPADSGDLAEKILIALDREWDREKILAYAERFTWENISREIVGVYKNIC